MANSVFLHISDWLSRLFAAGRLRRYGVVFAAGAFATLALPPVYIWLAGLIGFAALYEFLARTQNWRAAAAVGYVFHLGYFIAGLYWIAHAMLADGSGRFIWLYPVAAVGLPMVLAIYGAVLGIFAHAAARRWGYYTRHHAVCFAVAFFAIEWLRGHLWTGFPWNISGYMMGFSDYLSQSASLFGVYGLGLVMIGLSLAAAFYFRGDRRGAIAGCVVLAAMLVFGAWRIPPDDRAAVDGVNLRLVQPSIAQNLKWDPKSARENFYRLIDLSKSPSDQPVTHIIWPETAVPYPVDRNRAVRLEMARHLPKGAVLLFGAPRARYNGLSQITDLYNSLLAIDGDGDMIAEYNKSHLVPFGEYVPLPKWLPIEKIAHGLMDYTPGPGRQTMDIPGLPPFSPLICYEVIFPGSVQSPNSRAQWLLNITNDAWYGKTAGPYQHLAHARMRAIEEGLPLVRVANNGISAVIDAYGRTWARLDLNDRGYIDSALPLPAKNPTWYKTINSLWVNY